MTDIAIIPARGGSKGIPRKNIRELNGKPLITYTIATALESGCFDEVVVTTDHDEIAHIAREAGAEVHMRPAALADDVTTLDAVVHDVVQARGQRYDIVATLQPTAPLLRATTLSEAIEKFRRDQHVDTLLSVVNEPHLSWSIRDGLLTPNYEKRVNRQFLPPFFKETGAFIVTRGEFVQPHTRFGPNVSVFEIPVDESVDIDSMQDWWIVENLLRRKKIAIRVDSHWGIGFGHVYRMLLLANRLLDHRVHFYLDESHVGAVEIVHNAHYAYTSLPREEIAERIAADGADIVILDILDTTAEEVRFYRSAGACVVTFEDLGKGMAIADLTLNALYESEIPFPHVHTGPDFYCLREEFAHTTPREIADKVESIVTTFGGSDPTNQTLRSVVALAGFLKDSQTRNTVILGMGYPDDKEVELLATISTLGLGDLLTVKRRVQSMASEFKGADLVITSCGRTMYEVATLGVPAVLIAQNDREMRHAFGHAENGFANLGLGEHVSDERLVETVARIAGDAELRREMRKRMLQYDFRGGLERVTRLILDAYDRMKSVRVNAGRKD